MVRRVLRNYNKCKIIILSRIFFIYKVLLFSKKEEKVKFIKQLLRYNLLIVVHDLVFRLCNNNLIKIKKEKQNTKDKICFKRGFLYKEGIIDSTDIKELLGQPLYLIRKSIIIMVQSIFWWTIKILDI